MAILPPFSYRSHLVGLVVVTFALSHFLLAGLFSFASAAQEAPGLVRQLEKDRDLDQGCVNSLAALDCAMLSSETRVYAIGVALNDIIVGIGCTWPDPRIRFD
jgi:hypothetical protein